MTAPIHRWLRQLGPGLITGAADDDPSGIATYSQAGAQFGFQLGWTVVLTYPLMVGIQIVSARMGRVTGHGLAANIRRHFPRPVLYAIVAMLVVANTINVAADIAAMGEALELVVGGPKHGHAIVFGVVSLLAAGLPAVPALRSLSQVADAGAARLRRGASSRSRCRGAKCCVGILWPRLALDRRCADRHRRRVRHHDQPLPVLLAGGAGSRGDQRRPGRVIR